MIKTQKMQRKGIYGTCTWSGTFRNMPAVVTSRHNGAELYVYTNGEWYIYAKGEAERDVKPVMCSTCGSELPHEGEGL